MKRALSRKNLWEALPHPVKTTVGRALGRLPLGLLLGRRFRRQLRFVRRADSWSPEEIRAYQCAELARILRLAYDRTPFYRELLEKAGFRPEDLRTPEDLSGLPTIDKNTVRSHLSEMYTISPDTAGVDYVSTGGTGGVPLQFYIGADRSAVEYAYLVTSWQRAGYRLGLPLAVFRGRVVPEDDHGLRHEYDPLLRQHYYSNFHMTDGNMARYLEHVCGIGECFLHGYPSSLAALARHLQRTNAEPPTNVRGMIAESEIVYPDQRGLIESTFRCRLFSCYGHTEKLVLAAECERSTDCHVWPTYGYFELLDENDRAVTTPGQRGEIVGTGFINAVVPFIRYRTGDYATYVGDHCQSCGRPHVLLRDIAGHRVQEYLVASDGAGISWTALNMHDNTFANVRQFQFFQDAPGTAELRVIPAVGFGEADEDRILRSLQRKFDGRLNFTIQLVESIPLSPMGKAIYVDQRIASATPLSSESQVCASTSSL